MSRPERKTWLLAGLLAAAALCGPAAASTHGPAAAGGAAAPPAAGVRLRAAEDERVSLDEAVRMVRQRYGDVTILKARTRGRNGAQTHVVKFLTESGRVRTVRVDAASGEMR